MYGPPGLPHRAAGQHDEHLQAFGGGPKSQVAFGKDYRCRHCPRLEPLRPQDCRGRPPRRRLGLRRGVRRGAARAAAPRPSGLGALLGQRQRRRRRAAHRGSALGQDAAAAARDADEREQHVHRGARRRGDGLRCPRRPRAPRLRRRRRPRRRERGRQLHAAGIAALRAAGAASAAGAGSRPEPGRSRRVVAPAVPRGQRRGADLQEAQGCAALAGPPIPRRALRPARLLLLVDSCARGGSFFAQDPGGDQGAFQPVCANGRPSVVGGVRCRRRGARVGCAEACGAAAGVDDGIFDG
mmetsp:Transcript_12764/g.34533  ORF Transcript_12764/g.34533 Transcript_12764/m.34533 type:complete len:297 (+) Transcript_12764:183-1073(+)